MKRKFDADAYLDACTDGDEILEFCHEKGINSYYKLVSSRNLFPEEKRERWFKRLCSSKFIKFLHTRGIK